MTDSRNRTSVIKIGQDPQFFSNSVQQITVVSVDNQSEPYTDRIIISKPPLADRVNSFLNSITVTIITSIATIYALFADYIKTLSFPKSDDNVFSSLVVTCIVIFTVEFVLSILYKKKYTWSFYFWLDLIATVSLIADIGWMWDSALGLTANSDSNSLRDAGKASKAGARVAGGLKIIRLVRLVRIVKLYKNLTTTLSRFQKVEITDEFEKEVAQTNESKVGKKMSDISMKRVIFMILFILFMMPLFEKDFYETLETSWEFGVTEMQSFLDNGGFEEVKNEYINYHKDKIRPIIFLKYNNSTATYNWIAHNINYWELRYNEIHYASTNNIIAIFDIRYDAKLSALLSICQVIYISIVLTLGSVLLSKDSELLVIKPIERMISKVKIIAKNPIAASEIQAASERVEAKTASKHCCSSTDTHNDIETRLVEDTIIKIGVLLALGFGEAGSLIIGSNIEHAGEVDPMANGSKIVGIYGFCDIRNFTDTTEELQEGVMMFVNEIAQVVHGIVDKYLGSPNKNIGDAFLLVWKFADDEFFLDDDGEIMKNPQSLRAGYLPDLALLSFLKILAKVNKDPSMLKYRTHQKLVQRMPNYEVKMGFGLHLGWSIEGAIGSQFKIDASYLSPHINIASALEGSTKLYGVPLLISGTLYEYFSDSIKAYCRQIDCVFIKGSPQAVGVYTSDCDFSEFFPGKTENRTKKFFRKKRIFIKNSLEKQRFDTCDMYMRSREIGLMRKAFSNEFFESFNEGLVKYLEGDWVQAKKSLEITLGIRSKDGPSLALISFMSEFGFQAPNDWKKARYLG